MLNEIALQHRATYLFSLLKIKQLKILVELEFFLRFPLHLGKPKFHGQTHILLEKYNASGAFIGQPLPR